jgi:7-cyano-7-deazaguanine synthase
MPQDTHSSDHDAKPTAIVLLSGGMDSCVTTAIANAAHPHRLALLHCSYGQRSERRERRAFDEIADFYAVPTPHRLLLHLDIFPQIGVSALSDTHIPVPEHLFPPSPTPSSIPVTYVPFRNAHFLSAAVSWAEVLGAHGIYIGAVFEDSSGYPDCRPDYYRAFQQVIHEGTKPETKIEIVTPVINMQKSEIIRRGLELKAPLHLTWSCYQFEDQACGVCDSCRLRLAAFAQAGVRDPIAYRAPVAR